MTRFVLLATAAAVLAGCGVDGEPIRPSMAANLGVGEGGLHTSTHLSAPAGNWTLSTGLGL